MKMVNIYAGHDTNITFCDTDKNKYHLIEVERLLKERYFRMQVDDWIFSRYVNDQEKVDILKRCLEIAEKFWGFENDWDIVSTSIDGKLNENILKQVFKSKEYTVCGDHHLMHASSTFYQSNFEKALIISYDGGGNDGFFNVYSADSEGISLLEKIDADFGGGYLLLSCSVEEVTKNSSHVLSLAGKLMGLSAYGTPDLDKIPNFEKLFIDRNYKEFSNSLGGILKNVDRPWHTLLQNYIFNSQTGYDFAATTQLSYEVSFLKIFSRIVRHYSPTNVCITGGGALNVLVNQKIKDLYELNIFVAPNPNDCGLSLGASFLLSKPKHRVDITYKGLPILDLENIDTLLKDRKYKTLNLLEVAQLLKSGKIIGIIRGDSEVGPRALGNRSIVCDPSYQNMKDILNAKVKFREWYRPFAPFCKLEDAEEYFESKNFHNYEFMSYAPRVKEKYKSILPSITHIDGTARLQCVTEKSHQFFHDLLNEFNKISDTRVLLNTSFNIRGNPILSTIEDALSVLDNTELDAIIIENLLILKDIIR